MTARKVAVAVSALALTVGGIAAADAVTAPDTKTHSAPKAVVKPKIHQSPGTVVNLPSGQLVPISATCKHGYAIGGSFANSDPNAFVITTESRVRDLNTWQFTFANLGGSNVQTTVYAMCFGYADL